eukprot:CAMPEP_0168590418 /NCGR_PEP_ID=MMETSP0420-20121227/6557_1 /TAXON_ID=498008 /ORGANISM="Pessonella sp." /LENGTH=655 /DNA_ID=CAMNT_0008626075 /DNA_START=243 /DNA_END=2210 /DNA_ORIENTATION=-
MGSNPTGILKSGTGDAIVCQGDLQYSLQNGDKICLVRNECSFVFNTIEGQPSSNDDFSESQSANEAYGLQTPRSIPRSLSFKSRSDSWQNSPSRSFKSSSVGNRGISMDGVEKQLYEFWLVKLQATTFSDVETARFASLFASNGLTADVLANGPNELDHALLLSMGVVRAGDRQTLLALTDRALAAKRRDADFISPDNLVALVAEQAETIGKLTEKLNNTKSKLDKARKTIEDLKRRQRGSLDPRINSLEMSIDSQPDGSPRSTSDSGPSNHSGSVETVPKPLERDDPVARRAHIIKEILKTERDYVRDLRWIVEQYVEPIESKELIPPEDQSHLFSNVRSLVQLHQEILKMLESSQSDTSVSIGQTFVRIGSYLKVYTTYVIDQEGTRDFVHKKFSEYPEFKEFCDRVKSLPQSRSLDLESYLIKPVQRVCKYPLLINDLLKTTPKTDPNHELLAQAVESMRDVASHINDNKKRVQAIQRVAEINQKISGLPKNFELAVPSRRYLFEGELTRVEAAISKKRGGDKIVLFLFNNLLIECKRKGSTYVVRQHIKLNDSVTADQLPAATGLSNGFQIVHNLSPTKRETYLYQCDTEDEMLSWLEHLKQVIVVQELIRRSGRNTPTRNIARSPDTDKITRKSSTLSMRSVRALIGDRP